MRIKLFLLLVLCFLITCFNVSAEEKKVIRVGISNQNFSDYNHQNVKISSSDAVKILDMSRSQELETIEPYETIEIAFRNSAFYIYKGNDLIYEQLNGPLLFVSNNDLEVLELNRKGTPARYKGMLEVRVNNNNTAFNLINIIDMQNYLRGVVSNEMPVSFGLEALKAQAIAARNYATNAQINPNYDVVDSTASQVYYGSNSYKDIADLAVYQTHGIYALHDEKPITALYFSTSPGITDDWDDVFGDGKYSGKHPYLKARYDLDNKELKSEKDIEEFYTKKDNGLDVNSPKFRWAFEFDRTELEEVLHETLQQQSKSGFVSPSYDGATKIEGIKEIKALKRTQSGKIIELEIQSKTGDYKVKTQLAIRRVFKKNGTSLPSGNFFVEASKKEESLLNENDDTGIIKIFDFSSDAKYPKSFKFIGGGFGHGVGMSQYGAFNLARQGKKYPDILYHYYTDIDISTVPAQHEGSEYNMNSKTEFYFEPSVFKEAYLFINNNRGVTEFPFKINEYEFNETRDIANKRVVKINITNYLKEGINVIEFAPLGRENRGRYIIYRVEFK